MLMTACTQGHQGAGQVFPHSWGLNNSTPGLHKPCKAGTHLTSQLHLE